jgi:hypothetical protein
MCKLILIMAAALFLATRAAHATGPDNCAVSKTPDGFLNVREAPTMKSKIIAKIHPADLVYADAYECDITDDCDVSLRCSWQQGQRTRRMPRKQVGRPKKWQLE